MRFGSAVQSTSQQLHHSFAYGNEFSFCDMDGRRRHFRKYRGRMYNSLFTSHLECAALTKMHSRFHHRCKVHHDLQRRLLPSGGDNNGHLGRDLQDLDRQPGLRSASRHYRFRMVHADLELSKEDVQLHNQRPDATDGGRAV